MAKVRTTYRGYSGTTIKARTSFPSTLTDIVVAGSNISYTNLDVSEACDLLSTLDTDIGSIFGTNVVNKYSCFGAFTRGVTGTPDIQGNGAFLSYTRKTSNLALGDFAGYNHNAVAPAITNTSHNADQTIASGGTATFDCDVTLGEMPYSLADMGVAVLGIAFIVWKGATLIGTHVRDISTLQDTTTFQVTHTNVTETANYTCQVRLLSSASSYTYNPTNVICAFSEIPDYTKTIRVEGANTFDDRHALTATYTFVNRQFTTGGYYSIQGLTGNTSYSSLAVTAWVEDYAGNRLTDILTLRAASSYTAGATIVSNFNQNIWKLNGVQLSLPAPSSDLVIVTYFDDAPTGAGTYYVATNGSDSNPGSLAQPWLTLNYAFNHISAGNTLYIRGGTYSPPYTTGTGDGGTLACAVYVTGKNGSAGAKFNVFNYPGETVYLTGANITTGSYTKCGILLNSCSYWYIKGINVTAFPQNSSTGRGAVGIELYGGHHNLIEMCNAYVIGGPGFQTRVLSGNGTTFLNCDAHDNYDPYSTDPLGGEADGFDIGFCLNDYDQTLDGCRAWNNSDDGFDMYQYPGYTGVYILKNCWSWHNGYTSGGATAGDGTGFKYGADNLQDYTIVRRTTTNCIAYNNRTRGFSQESGRVRKIFYNNTAYANNTWGFSFYGYDINDIVRNNVSFGNADGQCESIGTTRISDHNTWDASTGVTVNSADFVSVDGTQLATARNSDGSLPTINFLHLVVGSDLINKGVDVGLPYLGTAPDLGAFERQ